MKLKPTLLRSQATWLIAYALSATLTAWAQNLTLDQTDTASGSYTVTNGILGKATYTYKVTATLNGPYYSGPSPSPGDGLLGAQIQVSISTNQTGFVNDIPIELFGTGGTVGNFTVPGQPYTSPIKVDDPNDSFGNATVFDEGNDGRGGTWTFSYGIQAGPASISISPPPAPLPISLQAPASGKNEIDMADSADNQPLTGSTSGLFVDGGNVQLSNFLIFDGGGGTNDIGTCSMEITMDFGYIYKSAVGYEVATVGNTLPLTLKVQYVRGNQLFSDNCPTMTASASPSVINPGQTETITVQIHNPSPDLATTNGTLEIVPSSLNGLPAPPAVQNITIPPQGTVTNTFQITPVAGGNYNPQITFYTYYPYPVPATVPSHTILTNAPFVVNIPVAVQANPSGPSFTVDGTAYSAAQAFNWAPGSFHTLGTRATQNGGPDVQYLWNSWSDLGAVIHTVSPTSGTTYTVNFTTQYFLTMATATGGSVSPGSGWTDAGAAVPISATANSDYRFSGWTGTGTVSYSGSSSSSFITMNSPIIETADFVAMPPLSFGPLSRTGNEFQTTLSGLSSGEQVVLEVSPDLKNWVPVQTNTSSGPTFTFAIPINPALKGQYFRATAQ